MNTLIFHTALALEALANRLIRAGFWRLFTLAALAAPLLLLASAALRYDDAIERARHVVHGSEQLVAVLIAALLLRAGYAFVLDLVVARFYRPQADAGATPA
jgi:hypothetical protein